MRSAKSVQWMRLKVVGVNISFFLPRRVVSRTSGEEFHSLKATAKPCERSQWLKRESWVDFPEPSMPSTTMSLPRYRFGTKSDIYVCCRRPFYPDADEDQPFAPLRDAKMRGVQDFPFALIPQPHKAL